MVLVTCIGLVYPYVNFIIPALLDKLRVAIVRHSLPQTFVPPYLHVFFVSMRSVVPCVVVSAA